MAEDIGENLVGSYLRHIEKCQFVVFNTHIPNIQGEIDVIGIHLRDPRKVWFCEVITHTRGILYGTYEETVSKIRAKVERAKGFAELTFPGYIHRYEVWSPYVPVGRLTAQFKELEDAYNSAALDLSFVINKRYTDRIQRLVDHARKNTAATSEPSYRLLQILTSLRGRLTV